MEQKLYYLDINYSDSCEMKLPQDLCELLNDRWFINQISSYGYCMTRNNNPIECSILLLEKASN